MHGPTNVRLMVAMSAMVRRTRAASEPYEASMSNLEAMLLAVMKEDGRIVRNRAHAELGRVAANDGTVSLDANGNPVKITAAGQVRRIIKPRGPMAAKERAKRRAAWRDPRKLAAAKASGARGGHKGMDQSHTNPGGLRKRIVH